MKYPKLEVFDPAMCCSTGVCGPGVDPKLVQFAADLKWLQDQGVEVHRSNLAQNPAAFIENAAVREALTEKSEGALPLLLVDGRIVSSGCYPERNTLAAWLGVTTPSACCGGKADEPRSSCCGGGSGTSECC